MQKTWILIPSLDPDEKLIDVIKSLKNTGFSHILLVDDGSFQKDYFQQAETEFGCLVLSHPVNLGKGAALKTGFSYLLSQNFSDCNAVVTVDGDNQHKAEDVLAVSRVLQQNPHSLVLGVRQFQGAADVPLRSRVGNAMSAKMFSLLSGKNISDSQTGLRGIPLAYLPQFLDIPGERFEFEMNMLFHLRQLSLDLVQVPISTVYLEENASSHFRPIWDSLRVFQSLLKFAGVGIFCFLLDYMLFTVSLFLVLPGENTAEQVFYASVLARICSSLVNFSLNYKLVFESDSNKGKAFCKYYCLVLVQMLLSSGGSSLLTLLWENPLIMKPLVDFFLFFLSYHLQRRYIFKKKGNSSSISLG